MSAEIILLGFGNVGQSIADLLDAHDGYRSEGVSLSLHSVFDRGGGVAVESTPRLALLDAKRKGGSVAALSSARRVEFEAALEQAPEAVVVDSTVTNARTGQPGLRFAREALERGHSVVFASKGPLVVAFAEILELARRKGVRLAASAAVGIPLPSFEVGLSAVRGAGLHRFRGVLNDTSNQILRDLEGGIPLDAAIERARLAGTLEEDPSLDVDGWDASYKLLILARAIWEPALSLDDVATTGVRSIGKKELHEARTQRRRVRLVATASRDVSGAIRLSTAPEALPAEDPLHALGPGEKGVVFETVEMGRFTLRSSKGGPRTTAACVLKDVLNLMAPRLPF